MNRKYSCAEKTRMTSASGQQHEPEQGGGGCEELMSRLPTEILMGILGRLPIKTLSTCRFVCKSWFSTICCPSFTTTYRDGSSCLIIEAYNDTPPKLIGLDRRGGLETVTLKLPPLDHNHNLWWSHYTSSNGLLVITSCSVASVTSKHFSYYVCNPVTGAYIALPDSPGNEEFHTAIGLGCDPVSKVWKLVRLFMDIKTKTTNIVGICSLATRKWRVLKGEELLIKSLYDTDLVNASVNGNENSVSVTSAVSFKYNVNGCPSVNGGLHWIANWKTPPHCSTIISFKLDTEEFHQLPVPSELKLVWIDGETLRLLEVRECLSLVHSVDREHVEIWVMEEYGLRSSWEKRYIITNIVTINGDLVKGLYMPMKLLQNGEILLFYHRGKRVGCYHPVTKAFRILGSIDDEESHVVVSVLHVCSLTSPFSISI